MLPRYDTIWFILEWPEIQGFDAHILLLFQLDLDLPSQLHFAFTWDGANVFNDDFA